MRQASSGHRTARATGSTDQSDSRAATGVLNDLFGGRSMIVDQRGKIIVEQTGLAPGDSFVSTVIDIDALRRDRQSNGVFNGIKDLRTEQYAAIYAEPIYPKNQYLAAPPAEGWIARERASARWPRLLAPARPTARPRPRWFLAP